MICWGGSQGDHPCENAGTNPSGLCDVCEAFVVKLAEALKAKFS